MYSWYKMIYKFLSSSESIVCIIFLMIDLESYTFFFFFLFIFDYNKSSILISYSLLPWDHISFFFQLPWLLFSPFSSNIFLCSMRGLILYDFVKLLLYAHISWSYGVEIKHLSFSSCITLFSILNFGLELENWCSRINFMSSSFYSFLRVIIGGCNKLRSFWRMFYS